MSSRAYLTSTNNNWLYTLSAKCALLLVYSTTDSRLGCRNLPGKQLQTSQTYNFSIECNRVKVHIYCQLYRLRKDV